MNAPTRLPVFGLGLVAVFGAALGAGRLAGRRGRGAPRRTAGTSAPEAQSR